MIPLFAQMAEHPTGVLQVSPVKSSVQEHLPVCELQVPLLLVGAGVGGDLDTGMPGGGGGGRGRCRGRYSSSLKLHYVLFFITFN